MPAFNYFVSVTGDCSNISDGVIELNLYGSTPPYTVEFISPITNLYTGVTENVIVTGLSANNYYVRINDSSLPTNQEFYVNIPISNGVCGAVVSLFSTTCDLNNGSVTLSASSLYSSTSFVLYDTDNNFISSAITNTSQYQFTQLSAGTYYCEIIDIGGCTGRTADFIIETSSSFDFGLYVVPNTSCGGEPTGKIFVTGQTGNPPYSYIWGNGQTSSSITGLTSGSYSVQVQDATGCSKTKSTTITDVNQVGLGVVTTEQPNPFSSDGIITLTISGGTAPFYYSASTGNFQISYLRSWSLSGLSYGDYIFSVTDAAFCNFQTTVNLLASNGMSSVDVEVKKYLSSSNEGSITATVVGGNSPYTYTLTYPNSNVVSVTNNELNYTFNGLLNGSYELLVKDFNLSVFKGDFVVFEDIKFDISILTTGATCNQDNGVAKVELIWGECNCCENDLYVYTEDIIVATGNTISDRDNKVWIEYTDCSGELITQSFNNEGVYNFCATGNCTTSNCTLWSLFNEGEEIVEYEVENCAGQTINIEVSPGQYSKSFCFEGYPPNIPLLLTAIDLGSCSECNCFDGTTNGVFSYFDCENIFVEGESIGQTICFNKNLTNQGVTELGESTTCDCNIPNIYIWVDDVKQPLPRGYYLSGNISCCSENGPSFPVTYSLDNGVQVVNNSFSTSITFNGLSYGEHTISVTDSQGYIITKQFIITASGGIDFTLFATSCGDGNEGSISVIINNGIPPFEFIWSNNVPGNPQTYLIENLSADTYTLSVTDSEGCCSSRSVEISCFQTYNPYLYYVMGEEIFQITPIGKCSILKLFNDGYQEVKIGLDECSFFFAVFTAKVRVTPGIFENESLFYVSSSLLDVPSDEEWVNTIVQLLYTIPGVYSVDANLGLNQIVVTTIPGDNSLSDSKISIDLDINYFFQCEGVS
jgi:hypothetical protein